MSNEKNVHSGHRMRVKERFCEAGLSSFADHNVLELVLFYSVPRKDTNELAHRLLDHFGSLHAVFEANVERLMEVPGISYNSAVLIKLFTEVSKRYSVSKNGKRVVFKSTDDIAKYVSGLFIGETIESFYILCVDGRGCLMSCEKHSTGSVLNAPVCIPVVIDTVVRNKACAVIVAHNHPNNTADPSGDDIEITKKLYKLLKAMNITLLDHVVVGCDGKCRSIEDIRRLECNYEVNSWQN